MAIITSMVRAGQEPSKAERMRIRAELQEAKKHSVNLEDCPELAPEVLKEFALLRADKKRLGKRQTISVRLSPCHIEKYKKFGKGYTGIMANVLAHVADHPEMLMQCVSAEDSAELTKN